MTRVTVGNVFSSSGPREGWFSKRALCTPESLN